MIYITMNKRASRRNNMGIELLVMAVVFTLIVLLTGGPSNHV